MTSDRQQRVAQLPDHQGADLDRTQPAAASDQPNMAGAWHADMAAIVAPAAKCRSRSALVGYELTYDNNSRAPAQHARRTLARRPQPDACRAVAGDVRSALHPQHRHRPIPGQRTVADHGRRRGRRGRLPQRARRQRRRRRGGDPDRDAGDVRPVADGQGRRPVGPVRRGDRQPRHRTPPRRLRAPVDRSGPAGLFRDDRDRSRKQRASTRDHRHLRAGHRGVRHQLPDPVLTQGLHRRGSRKRHGWQPFSRS